MMGNDRHNTLAYGLTGFEASQDHGFDGGAGGRPGRDRGDRGDHRDHDLPGHRMASTGDDWGRGHGFGL